MFKLGLKQLSNAGVPAEHLEFALRGFLLKISVCDAILSPLPLDINSVFCLWGHSLSGFLIDIMVMFFDAASHCSRGCRGRAQGAVYERLSVFSVVIMPLL